MGLQERPGARKRSVGLIELRRGRLKDWGAPGVMSSWTATSALAAAAAARRVIQQHLIRTALDEERRDPAQIGEQRTKRGGRRIRAAGAEFEAPLSFAGLGQLLGPVLGWLSALDEMDRRALRVSLGLVDGTASEEAAVAIATLRLRTAVAAVEPVLAVVDDVNWLGPRERVVLAYVARRVGGTRIALIATMRTGQRTPFERGASTHTSSSRCRMPRRAPCCKRASRA